MGNARTPSEYKHMMHGASCASAYRLVLLVWRTDLKLEDQVQGAWAAAAEGQARQGLQLTGAELLMLSLLLVKLQCRQQVIGIEVA